MTDDIANQADSFCVRYGNKLDAILTMLQLDPDACTGRGLMPLPWSASPG